MSRPYQSKVKKRTLKEEMKYSASLGIFQNVKNFDDSVQNRSAGRHINGF
jgi:hypothetical protein